MPMCTLACNRIVRVNDARAVLPISHDSVLEATTGQGSPTRLWLGSNNVPITGLAKEGIRTMYETFLQLGQHPF